MEFLPLCRQDMLDRGWDRCDFVYVIGDAYVDHPSFGHAIISRVLEAHGYTVGIISQPDWKNPKSIDVYGRPRLGFLVSGGNMDSMVNHYSVTKHRRKTDSFTPGGVMGKRPDYATVVYCNLIRQTYQDVPILIGGIEASLRRLGHYDYWSESMKRSILLDSQADILMYGMGERSIVELADALNSGLDVKDITYVDGTVFKTAQPDDSLPTIFLPSFEEIRSDKRRYAESFKIQYGNCDPFTAKRLAESYGHVYVVQNPPQKPLTTEEMDAVYALPYCRTYHPSYEKAGGVPRHCGGEVQPGIQPGLLRSLFLLRPDLPSGPHRPDPLPRVHPHRGGADGPGPGFQGLHPRRRRPHRQLPPPGLRKADDQRRLRRTAVPLPHPLQKYQCRPLGLCGPAAETAENSRGEKGLYPQRHPL